MGGLDAVAQMQLAAYARLTEALHLHADAAAATRGLGLLASAVCMAALVAVAVRLRVHPVAVASVLALLAAWPPAVAVLATLTPGLLGTTWLTLGAALVALTRGVSRGLGVVAIVLGVLTAPLLAVPVAVLVVAVTARRWAPISEIAAALGCAALVIVLMSPTSTSSGAALADRRLLVAAAAAVVLVALFLRGLRVAASATAAVAVLAAIPSAVFGTASPALIIMTVALAGAELDELIWHLQRRPRWARGVVVGLGAASCLAVAVPAVVAAATRTPPPATMQPPAAAPTPVSRVESDADIAARASVGRQLTNNPNLVAPIPVRAAIASGALDMRAVVVLVGLARQGPVTVLELPTETGDDPLRPRHRVTLAALDEPGRAWLRAQRPAIAPVVVSGSRPVILTWPASPSTFTLSG